MSSGALGVFRKVSSRSPNLPLADVLGIGVHAVNLQKAVDVIESAVDEGRRGYVCVTGVHGIMEAHRSPGIRRILRDAMLVVPDGMPTVWLGRHQGHGGMRRVFGPDLMLEVCQRSVPRGYTHFLYGGKPGVSERLKDVLEGRFPGIKVVGSYTPPFRQLTPSELNHLRSSLEELDPDLVWVGLSTPKQERFMAAHVAELTCRVMVGVGAAFDLHTGNLKDAPAWVKNAGLQWAHRLWQDPARLWKRYLLNNSGFVLGLVLKSLGLRKYQLEEANDEEQGAGTVQVESQ